MNDVEILPLTESEGQRKSRLELEETMAWARRELLKSIHIPPAMIEQNTVQRTVQDGGPFWSRLVRSSPT